MKKCVLQQYLNQVLIDMQRYTLQTVCMVSFLTLSALFEIPNPKSEVISGMLPPKTDSSF